MSRTKSTPRPADDGRLWLYGKHAVIAALTNPARPRHRLIATRNGALAAAEALNTPLERLDIEIAAPKDLDRLVPPGAVHQGLALETAPLPNADMAIVCAPSPDRPAPLAVALDQVTDPQNMGAVLRIAAAFDAAAAIATHRHSPAETGALAKAASGALESVPVARVVNLARGLGHLQDMGFRLVGLDVHTDTDLSAAAESCRDVPTVLVLGAEGKGLRAKTQALCDVTARIPMTDRVESLNVSAAAAIAMYALSLGR